MRHEPFFIKREGNLREPTAPMTRGHWARKEVRPRLVRIDEIGCMQRNVYLLLGQTHKRADVLRAYAVSWGAHGE
jgi:hypothetical protein